VTIQYPAVYVPGLVPQGGTLEATQRFLAEELERIATALRLNTVQPAYGLCRINTNLTGVANIAPQRQEDWESVGPAVPNRTICLIPDGRITVEEDGTFYIFFNVSVLCDTGEQYFVEFYLNGAATGIFMEIDNSNQTSAINISGSGMAQLRAGDYIEFWYYAGSNGAQWDVQTANFGLFRISELQNVRDVVL
jgi:hypothetical protein